MPRQLQKHMKVKKTKTLNLFWLIIQYHFLCELWRKFLKLFNRKSNLLNNVIRLILPLQFYSKTVFLYLFIISFEKKCQFCLLTVSCLRLSLSHKHQQSDCSLCTKCSSDRRALLVSILFLHEWQNISDFSALMRDLRNSISCGNKSAL